jgi:hypothetical protein
MSDKQKYTNIEIDTKDISEAKQLLMLALLNEGRLRERERIVELVKVWWETDKELEELIDLINGETNE